MTRIQEPGVFSYAIAGIEALSETVRRIVLRPTDGPAMAYREGQFLSVTLPDGDARCYSMATPSRNGGVIELHVRLQPGGRFSEWLTRELKTGDVLRVAGPFGDCVLDPSLPPRQSLVMLATGTGVAPLKAMIESLLDADDGRPIRLYWGGLSRADLYLLDHFHALETRWSGFRFIPALAAPDADWTGRRGFVQNAVAADFPTLKTAVVYACGAPVMVEAARRLLIGQRGLLEENFHADVFAPSARSSIPGPAPATDVIRLDVTPAGGVPAAIEARVGMTLLQALKAAGQPVFEICGGRKSCGTCRVGLDPLTPTEDRDELRLLASLGAARPGERLACQIRLDAGHDGLRVRLPALPF